jgi:glycosyltransferase involved in cell wall biosynthesis
LTVQGSAPRISVIIPAYEAANHLGSCLQALQQQTSANSQYEVIVVDDHSEDQTGEIARAQGVRLLRHERNRGAAAARNTGATAALGDTLLFIDSDVVPGPSLIDAVLDLFPSPKEGPRVATGRYSATPANNTRFARYKALWTWYCWQQSASEAGESSHIQGALAVIRTELFHELGGFDETYSGGSVEDYEFSLRIKEAGETILFDDRIEGRHHFPGFSTCARNYWDRARMWARLAPSGRRFSSGQANPRAAAASVFALGTVVGHGIPIIGLPLALVSDIGYLVAMGPFLRFVNHREGLPFALYAGVVHWSLSVVVGTAALTSPFGRGSRLRSKE